VTSPMTSIRDLLREDLRGATPYGAPQLDVPVRLNTNESSYPVPPAVVEEITIAVGDVAHGLNRYPDREFTDLRTALAAYLSKGSGTALDAAQVWAGNGSNEVLQHLVLAFGGPGRTALGFTPAYSMHPIISRSVGTTWVDGLRGRGAQAPFDLTAESAAEQVRAHDPHVVFLCSPNNPTGTALDLDVVSAVYESASGLVVVDEAYAEFSSRPSAVTLLKGRPRLVVTRTMSKAFALAGARVGYLAADPELVDALQLVRLPYHLSATTQAAALAALAHTDELLATVQAVREQRDRLVDGLRGMGLEVIDSDANFVLFGEFGDQRSTWQGLLDRGVLVRDVGLPGWLRVTAGTEDEVTAFLDAMRDGLGEVP
jgi:histidinol-phosphate aminotransferase